MRLAVTPLVLFPLVAIAVAACSSAPVDAERTGTVTGAVIPSCTAPFTALTTAGGGGTGPVHWICDSVLDGPTSPAPSDHIQACSPYVVPPPQELAGYGCTYGYDFESLRVGEGVFWACPRSTTPVPGTEPYPLADASDPTRPIPPCRTALWRWVDPDGNGCFGPGWEEYGVMEMYTQDDACIPGNCGAACPKP
jgi:hypothetical protein